MFLDKEMIQHHQLKHAMTFYQKLNKTEFQKELENLIEYGLKNMQIPTAGQMRTTWCSIRNIPEKMYVEF